jgi:hypothetical protein
MRTIGRDLYVPLSSPTGRTVYRVSPTDTEPRPTPIALPGSSGGMLSGGARGVYFLADPTGSGDLWWKDGEQAPIIVARPHMDGSRGMTSSSVANLSAAGTLTYFTALDRSGGRYLWRSDGTPDGTWPIVPAPPRTEVTLRYSEPAFRRTGRLSTHLSILNRSRPRILHGLRADPKGLGQRQRSAFRRRILTS